jgi:hypothetical protein
MTCEPRSNDLGCERRRGRDRRFDFYGGRYLGREEVPFSNELACSDGGVARLSFGCARVARERDETLHAGKSLGAVHGVFGYALTLSIVRYQQVTVSTS